jgi:hypothetical protein
MFDSNAGRGHSGRHEGKAQRLVGRLFHVDRTRPLPRLADVHPGHATGGRWIGLHAVPVECIRGTATAGGPRASDFRPLLGRATADWRFRWSRLESAMEEETALPPIQLIRVAGDYWIVDGHNRVALAKEHGQLWIDADINELDLTLEPVGSHSSKEN